MIVVHAGNRIDGAGRSVPRFPQDREGYVRERFAALLVLLAPDGVVTAPAAGADLLLTEAAVALSIPVHLVLPFDAGRFRAQSVADGGPRWTNAYEAALAAATGNGSRCVLDHRPDDDGFRAANAGLLRRAAELAPGRVLAVAVRPRGGSEPPSVTDDFVRRAEAASLFVVEIDPLAEV